MINFHALRWNLWAFIFGFSNANYFTNLTEKDQPLNLNYLMVGLFLYALTGTILELSYRFLVWGRLNKTPSLIQIEHAKIMQSLNKAKKKSLPENNHPWVSLDEQYPDPYVVVEILFTDNNIRIGTASLKEKGKNRLIVKIEQKEIDNLKQNSVNIKPTHWRHISGQKISINN
jgi:hypothetical protein